MQILQTCRKIFYQRPTILRSLSAFDFKVNLVQKNFSANFPYRQVARSFDNPAEEKLPESRAKFDQCPKIMNKITIFEIFSFKILFEDVYCSFVGSIGKVATQNREVFAPRPMMLNFLKKYPCHQKFTADNWNPDFTKPPEKFQQIFFRSKKQYDEKRKIFRGKNFWKCC